MKNFFSKDSVLRVISIIVAVLIWSYIIIVIDPSVDIVIRDIPIKYINRNSLAEQGLCLRDSGKSTVELKVRGSRKKIASIDNKNVYATVDLSNITKPGSFSLPIGISIPYDYSEIVSKKPYNADVTVDKVAETEKSINITTSGSVASGCIAGPATANVGTVVLRGAVSVLDEIGGVGASIDYGGRSADISDTVKLYFTDKSGKKLEPESSVYSEVKMYADGKEITEAELSCSVFKLKTVPVKVAYSENDESKAEYKISVQPSNLTVYGTAEELEGVSEIMTVPVNFGELSEKGTVTAAVVIPENISLRDGITEVTVKAAHN